jgi:hypothetical protein
MQVRPVGCGMLRVCDTILSKVPACEAPGYAWQQLTVGWTTCTPIVPANSVSTRDS